MDDLGHSLYPYKVCLLYTSRLLFNKYLKTIEGTDMTMERNLIRTWIYVTNIDVNYQGDVYKRQADDILQ